MAPENGKKAPKKAGPGSDESTDAGGRPYPEPPDLARVQRLRDKLQKDRATKDSGPPRMSRLGVSKLSGKQARDIGAYTLIPMLMVAGPLVGFLLGTWIEEKWGGTPWPTTVGVLLGLVAGFRQVFLLLAARTRETSSDNDGPET
jgi:F0F1-type ATP synthase assembly protein I